jgi:hypothetical protein
MNDTCLLCDEKKPLIEAHIIREFFYKNLGLYEPDKKGQGRIHTATIFKDEVTFNKKGIPIGIYDKNILCESCDNFINQEYENYSKQLLFNNSVQLVSIINGVTTFTNIDYVKFKLFVLSIFWRASISERKEFNKMKFPNDTENLIKGMIKNKDAGSPNEFPIILYYLYAPDMLPGIITDIKSINNNGVLSHAFIAGGMLFYLYLKESEVPDSLVKATFKAYGELNISTIPTDKSIEIIYKFLR